MITIRPVINQILRNLSQIVLARSRLVMAEKIPLPAHEQSGHLLRSTHNARRKATGEEYKKRKSFAEATNSQHHMALLGEAI